MEDLYASTLTTLQLLFPEESYPILDLRTRIKSALDADARANVNTRIDTSASAMLFTSRIEAQYIETFRRLVRNW